MTDTQKKIPESCGLKIIHSFTFFFKQFKSRSIAYVSHFLLGQLNLGLRRRE